MYGRSHELVNTLNYVAMSLLRLGYKPAATEIACQAIAIKESKCGRNSPRLRKCFVTIGSCWLSNGFVELAEVALKLGFELSRRCYGDQHADSVLCKDGLQHVLEYHEGSEDDAEQLSYEFY